MVDKKIDVKKKKEKVKDNNKNRRIEKNKKQRYDIAKKEHIENTVNVTKILVKIIIILLIIFTSIYVTCRYIGTSGLIVREYSIDYDNLPDSFYGLKVIQISDVNYNEKTMPIDKVKKVIDKVNALKPDIIVFTGDLVYGDATQKELSELEKYFSSLEAKVGKYAIFGEDDDLVKILIKNAGFMDIENNYDLIYVDNSDPILITGIDDENINLESTFAYFNEENANEDIFTITLMHKPDSINNVLNYHHVDIAFAGHSLNGLINIPGLGGIVKVDGAKTYVNNYYKEKNTDLYISSGLGTRKYPYRLFNHPSISLFRLK